MLLNGRDTRFLSARKIEVIWSGDVKAKLCVRIVTSALWLFQSRSLLFYRFKSLLLNSLDTQVPLKDLQSKNLLAAFCIWGMLQWLTIIYQWWADGCSPNSQNFWSQGVEVRGWRGIFLCWLPLTTVWSRLTSHLCCSLKLLDCLCSVCLSGEICVVEISAWHHLHSLLPEEEAGLRFLARVSAVVFSFYVNCLLFSSCCTLQQFCCPE